MAFENSPDGARAGAREPAAAGSADPAVGAGGGPALSDTGPVGLDGPLSAVSGDGAVDVPVPVESVRVKVVVVGGFGVGKTTFVASGSQISGLFTEAALSVPVRPGDGVGSKASTTVAMDFGRTLLAMHTEEPVALFLFGVPGQERFAFMWDALVTGALGGVVLVDTRRVQECFAAVSLLERSGVPFVVAVNAFPGAPCYPPEVIREALQVPVWVPVLGCDARRRPDVLGVLIGLTEFLLTARGGRGAGGVGVGL